MSALLSRDGNAQHTSGSTGGDKQMAAGTENRPQDAQHKHGVAQKVADEKDKSLDTYISPSDSILSPATQKLAGFKQRQIHKQNAKTSTSRMLFGRTPSSCSNGGGDNDDDGR